MTQTSQEQFLQIMSDLVDLKRSLAAIEQHIFMMERALVSLQEQQQSLTQAIINLEKGQENLLNYLSAQPSSAENEGMPAT